MASPQTFYGQQSVSSGKCVLISSEKFTVELIYNEEAINIFKTIPSRCYDPNTRMWTFRIQDYDLVIKKLKSLEPRVMIEKFPNYVLKCIKAPNSQVTIDYKRLDPVLTSSLLPFQLEGLSFGIDKGGRCLIADDMGLGKTFQALAIANYYMEEWPVLIVTTASMKTTWEETITNYMPTLPILCIQYMVSGKDFIGDCKALIVSHDMMSRAIDKLLAKRFGIIIIDESHVLKSCKSQCFKSAQKLCNKAKRVILLSGTPALSRPCELYTQLSLIDSKFFGSFFEYTRRYCDGKQTRFGWDASGKSNLKELEIILYKKYMIRRTRDDVLKSLPNKKQEIITLDASLQQVSKEDKTILATLEEKYNSHKGAGKHSLLLNYFHETARIKIPAVCSYILQMLEENVKFLVFAHHQVILDAIENVTKKKNVKFIRIDGNTTAEQRKFFISKFQYDDNYVCAILSITSANAGITLTAAQLVLFAELHWNPSIISQAEARAHRIGQEHQVVVRYLLAPGTADDPIWNILQQKQSTLKEVGLCSKDSFEDVEVKKQNKTVISEGLDLNLSRVNSGMQQDIRMYLSPEKRRKIDHETDNSMEDFFNDGLDDILSETVDEAEKLFDDGLNDILCNINV